MEDWMEEDRKTSKLSISTTEIKKIYGLWLLFTQFPILIEYSDKPTEEKLTLTHLFGPMLLHAVIMALATIVWIGELCFGAYQRKKSRIAKTTPPMYPFLEW